MQTFLPYKDFNKTARVLDNKRLNKQILECYQILKVLNNPDPRAGWRNHPAVKMWRGYEKKLFEYTMAMVKEANVRNIKTDKNVENLTVLRDATLANWGSGLPKWYEGKDMIRVTTTHRANLYNKDPEYYYDFMEYAMSEKNEPCCEKCNYYWPTHILAV